MVKGLGWSCHVTFPDVLQAMQARVVEGEGVGTVSFRLFSDLKG